MRKLLFAGFCALFFGSSVYLIAGWFYETAKVNAQSQPEPEPLGNTVLVNAKVKAGDPVQRGNLQVQPIYPPHTPPDDLLLDFEADWTASPAIFSRELAAGSVVRKSDILMPDDPGYISHLLKRGMRAKSLTITNLSKYDGLVHQGDAVDILFISSGGQSGEEVRKPTAQTLIRKATVIGPVPNRSASNHNGSADSRGKSLVFALSLQDAVKASLAEEVGKLTIVLRKSGRGEERPADRSGTPLATLADLVSHDPSVLPQEDQTKVQKIRVMRGSELTTISVPGRAVSGAE